jgi:3-mercaptopyruvate sulfurtransferase SseA
MKTALTLFTLTLAALASAAGACGPPADGNAAPTPAASSNAAPPNSPGGGQDPFASVPRVRVEELAAALREGRAVALDVRPAEAFEVEHIKGAVNIPEEEVVERAGELPKEKLVVAYCA